jgi:hypothetical protein
MASHSTKRRFRTLTRLVLLITIAGGIASWPALAQEKKESDKPAAAEDGKNTDATKAPPVSDRDTIGFSQQNAAAQMNELEERMFRLSEALRGLEPENASRLRLALKFSRDEQILEQMRENHKLLKDAQLSKAETEAKELLAKLEHLRNLLLAEDLDFQLKLVRLRQMRETLGQIDRLLKEERRELGWSRFAIEERKRLDRFAARRPDLEALVREQQAVIAETKNAPKGADQKAKDARTALRSREEKLRNAATALATDPLFADLQPPHLRRADGQLAEAMASLGATELGAAVTAEDKALGMLRDELARLDNQVAESQRTIGEAEFRRRSGDQTKNRGSTEGLEVTSARLGEVSVGLRKDLIRAAASMRAAEQKLSKTDAGPAADDQSAALDILAKTRDEFTRYIERLLVELRAELQHRLIADVTEMHELQAGVRETTQAQAPKVLQKSRSALIMVSGLSKNEAELGERTERLLTLVEETEYGIALPATLRILSREMRSIEKWLKEGDVSARTTSFETRIEEDLLGLAQAVRRLPPTTPPPIDAPQSTDERQRDRELNRLVGELKMVRMIQARLNDDTSGVEKTRVAASVPAPVLRNDIETLEATQDEIRDSLAKIADKLPFPLGTNQ